jgi:hypothetical protein
MGATAADHRTAASMTAQVPLSFARAARANTRSDHSNAGAKKAAADEGLRRAFDRAIYSLEASGDGAWRGANAAQRLTLEFSDREARLSHPDGSVNFHLTGYGYGDRLRKPAPARLTSADNRLEYDRGDLIEWYLNGSQGLEQGFTLAHRPGTSRDGEPLVIALGVSGGLLPVQETDGPILFESAKGVVVRYAGLRALDARGYILPSRLEARGGEIGEIRLIVEDLGARYPLVIDPLWTQQPQTELIPSDSAAGDNFGEAISMDGDTALIGASEAVYVFVLSGGTWTQQQKLTPPPGAVQSFGASISLSGDTAVIGSPALYPTGWPCAAYVFVRSSGVWTLQQTLSPSGSGISPFGFGSAAAVSGDTAVIGAPLAVIVGGIPLETVPGVAYVFERSGGVWSQAQVLTAPDGADDDRFGYSVAVSYSVAVGGGTIVVGAYAKNNDQGAAYVFEGSGAAWSLQQELTASDGGPGHGFGISALVGGDTAVVGALHGNGGLTNGAAYVFVQSGGVWSQQQELTGFGPVVALSGDTLACDDVGYAAGASNLYLFVRSGTSWSQQQQLVSGVPAFYGGVAVSGTTTMMGALDLADEPGVVYVYGPPTPDTILRDTYGGILRNPYATGTLSDGGGVFASDPSEAQDWNGNTLVTARDDYNAVWASVYNASTATWSGWQLGGGIIQGVPAIAVDTSGTGWIASRDTYNSYWLVSYTAAGGFGAWAPLLGIFSTDPVVTNCPDGSIYVIGKDTYGSLWSGQFIPGFGFQGWVFGGGVIQGKPAATCGRDNAVYVVARDNYNSNWMARATTNAWTGWFFGEGVTAVDPQIAELGGSAAVVILDQEGSVWTSTFTEGTGNGWQPWTVVGGTVTRIALAAVRHELFFAAVATDGSLWWWRQNGNQWTWIGNFYFLGTGALSASPR